ncbi:hypothetical protein NOCARDAX2BIS_150024 [Nocardioides sp. AX2bis]|nr:hypothetical protein NOCARDAX2BIS_150024 [Nocardioides sp. AX2bis]
MRILWMRDGRPNLEVRRPSPRPDALCVD